MISIVICSRNSEIDEVLLNNIEKTIGNVEYEIICIDNSCNEYSIFSAYQRGVELSKGTYLCFMHEDILFKSERWGEKCIERFLSNPSLGLLGVLGAYYLSQHTTGWVSSKIIKGQVIHKFVKNGEYHTKKYVHTDYDYLGEDVVAVDGLWMFMPKKPFNENLLYWDTKNYSGFHFYDMDISMQTIKNGMKIGIADIMIEHRSGGDFNRSFWENYLVFHKKWDSYLPVARVDIPAELLAEVQYREVKNFYDCQLVILDYLYLLKRMHFYFFYNIYIRIKNMIKLKVCKNG